MRTKKNAKKKTVAKKQTAKETGKTKAEKRALARFNKATFDEAKQQPVVDRAPVAKWSKELVVLVGSGRSGKTTIANCIREKLYRDQTVSVFEGLVEGDHELIGEKLLSAPPGVDVARQVGVVMVCLNEEPPAWLNQIATMVIRCDRPDAALSRLVSWLVKAQETDLDIDDFPLPSLNAEG